MNLDEAAALPDPAPRALETGCERLPDGVLHVAVRTDMHGCTGETPEWRFRGRCDTRKYICWHPVDYIHGAWQGELAQHAHAGSELVATEEFTGLPPEDLIVQFGAPEEFSEPEADSKAREPGTVPCAVLARTRSGRHPERLPDGAVMGGRPLHVGRDTPRGLALRPACHPRRPKPSRRSSSPPRCSGTAPANPRSRPASSLTAHRRTPRPQAARRSPVAGLPATAEGF
jgi:hypothetical protein